MSETRRFPQNMEKEPILFGIRRPNCCRHGICYTHIFASFGVRIPDDDIAWIQADGYESFVDYDAATGDVIITMTKA